MPAHWNVVAGVYRLGIAGSSSNSVVFQFTSHPEGTGEKLHLVPGDVLSTTVTLPAGVAPAKLPSPEETDGISSTWSSKRVGQGWAVTNTQTVTAPVETYGVSGGLFEATVTNQASTNGYILQAEATLPARFTSAQARMETKVPGKVSPPGIGRVAAGGGHSLAISQANRAGYGWGAQRRWPGRRRIKRLPDYGSDKSRRARRSAVPAGGSRQRPHDRVERRPPPLRLGLGLLQPNRNRPALRQQGHPPN